MSTTTEQPVPLHAMAHQKPLVAGIVKQPLLLRIRPNSEAAPWVIEEIKKLEGTIKELEYHFLMMEQWRSRGIHSDSLVGSCDCNVKTPETKHHKPGCKYRLISERDELREWQRVILSNFHPDCQVTHNINSLRGRTFTEA